MSDPTPSAPPVAVLEHSHSTLELAIMRYRKQLILVASVGVIGTLAWLGSKAWKDSRHASAGAAYTKANTVAELQAVASAHPDQIAGGNALLRSAELLASDNQTREAIANVRKFLESFPSHPLRDLGEFQLGELLTREGNAADARTHYQAVLASPGSAFGSVALLRLGDLAWGDGNAADAKDFYTKLITQYPGNVLFSEAESRLKQITRKAPELIDFVPEPTAPPAGADAPPSEDILKMLQSPGALDGPSLSSPGPAAGGSALETPAEPEAASPAAETPVERAPAESSDEPK